MIWYKGYSDTFQYIQETSGKQWFIRQVYNKSAAVAEMGDRLTTIDRAENWESAPFGGGMGPHLIIMSPGPRPTSVPSGILMHPAVWSQ